jgi:hypothetical protein
VLNLAASWLDLLAATRSVAPTTVPPSDDDDKHAPTHQLGYVTVRDLLILRPSTHMQPSETSAITAAVANDVRYVPVAS